MTDGTRHSTSYLKQEGYDTMMRSMFSGVSGLRTHQSRMDVIANNIANVNTTGFKASRMTFADTFSQTVQGASAPQALLGRGGTNPQQIGLGVNVSSIQRMMSQGGAMRTDDPFHMMIDGDGFFIVGDNATGLMFTRAGNFMRDRDYNIVMPNGLPLHGWPANRNANGFLEIGADGQTTIQPAPPQGIRITEQMRTVPALATGNITFDGNIDPTANVVNTQMNFHDSLGNVFTVDVRFTPSMVHNGAAIVPEYARIVGAWDIEFISPARRQDGTTHAFSPAIPAQRAFFGTDGTLHHIEDIATGTLTTTAGAIVLPNTGPTYHLANWGAFAGTPTTTFNFDLTAQSMGVTFGQPPPNITIDFSALTQMAGQSTPVGHDMDGMRMGTLIGLSVGPDGIITGTYSNGQSFALWQIALARFPNPAGLESVGNNLFAATSNSGAFVGNGFQPAAIASTILGGTLEMSNVDLAAEFTEMITTQRGFQANSRVITTSDEILQELVNLRR